MNACAQEELGSRIQVEIGQQQIEGIVNEAHDPDPIPSPDYVPRGEVYEKVWACLQLGAVEVPEGRMQLKARALNIAGCKVMELKSVILRQLGPYLVGQPL